MKRFKQFVLNHRKGWGTGIALYQLIGALVMFIVMGSNIPELSAGIVLVVIPLVGITLTGFIAGIIYFIKGFTLRFFTLSKLNFCFQLVQLSVKGFAFAFYYGPFLAPGYAGDSFLSIKFELLTVDFLLRFAETSQQFLYINLIPLIPILALRWIERNPVLSPEFENSFIEEQKEQ